MSIPLFPELQPRTVDFLWYCPDKGKNDVMDIDQIEADHQNWINTINQRCMDETPLGTPIEAPTAEDDEDDDDDDDDEEEEETDESHDNDNEESVYNNGSINGEIIPIASQSNDSIRNRINRSSR